jgi:thiol:disulfide interchange protein DsbA
VIRRLFAAALLVLSATLMATASAGASEFEAGKDYELINPALPAVGNGKVEVVELFWYGCPHCYQFEPLLHNWVANKPANVEFVRIPAIFNNPRWKLHAQAFYTAEVLDVMESFHRPFFDAIHKERQRMNSKREIRQFFSRIGVDGGTFDNTFESFAVQAKVRRAADMTRQYGISGVPSLVVNGQYRTDGPMAKSYERLLEVVNALVAGEAS